ncbi:hypothetical protein CASFOL_041575 [Castilleja foliolosa]|uniref:Ubiquitin-like protease family profile domain-containing protein n=1 Tax=Castilleja foliolosa TaxID=1961234 RepID=A0ABD3BB57_9LAMI
MEGGAGDDRQLPLSDQLGTSAQIAVASVQPANQLARTRVGRKPTRMARMTYWQLMVLCPKYNYVAWFCFMQNRPSKKISTKIETAFNAYQMMKGTHTRQLKKLKWLYPKCCGQGEGNDCGLQVMRHMFAIIKLDIVDSFDKAFNMDQPYSENDIDVVRRNWAECFLEVYYLEHRPFGVHL